jgi:hypothetical protein
MSTRDEELVQAWWNGRWRMARRDVHLKFRPAQWVVEAATDAAARAYSDARLGLPGLPAGTAGLVARIDGQLERLDGLRQQVTAGGGRASAVAFSYRISIAGLLSFRGSVGQAGGASAEVADHLRAAAAVSQASEAVGLLQVAVLRVAGQGPLSQAAVQEITAALTARLQAQQDFDAFATAAWQAALEQAQVGDDALVAQELEDAVARTVAYSTGAGSSDVPTCRRADVPTCRRADVPTCRRADVPTNS